MGVSHYNTIASLPACKSDTDLIFDIINSEGSYESILSITEGTTSSEVKGKIAEWIESFRGKSISEVLFYYTGHGDFHQNELYFPLSDYSGDKRKQTSLTNSEVDSWLRSLSPGLAVKVIDACHSGILYVKDQGDTFQEFINKSGGNFQKCYFLFSSASDQYSYQDNDLSFFTRDFAKAIYHHESPTVRYRDIIDYISDSFADDPNQTPFFVTQAYNTEIFCAISDQLKSVLAVKFAIPPAIQTVNELETPQKPALSLKQIIEQEARLYCTEDDALSTLQELRGRIEAHQYSSEFFDLYEVIYQFEESHPGRFSLKKYPAPSGEVVGEWLSKSEHSFFAEPSFTEEKYEAKVPTNDVRLLAQGQMTTTAIKTRNRISGFSVTVDLPFKDFQIIGKPKYENLPWIIFSSLFIVSKTKIRFFFFFAEYKELSWQDRKLPK